MIAEYEALGMCVWPAAEEIPVDGWTACLSEGTTRRTNSVQTFTEPAGALSLEARIDACERLYRERGLRAVFKITEASLPTDLEGELEARGYAAVDPTVVQEAPIAVAGSATDPALRVAETPDDAWFADCARLNDVSAERVAGLRAVLGRMPAPVAFASIREGGHAVTTAQAVGAVAGERLFLCLIATDTDARRRGLGRRVVEGVFRWAATRGVRTAWLQVVAANRPALALYDRLGFRERYRYWYRQPAS